MERQKPEKAKLPSYSACLKAQIKPQNFRLLKDYYELVVKDYELAKLNKTALLSKSKQSLQQPQSSIKVKQQTINT